MGAGVLLVDDAGDEDAGVVDPDVQSARARDHLAGRGGARLGVGHVEPL